MQKIETKDSIVESKNLHNSSESIKQNSGDGSQDSLVKRQKKESSTVKMVKIAFLSAISAILYMYISIPLPFFPPFLKLQISDIGAVIGSVMYGPLAGCLILVIKILLKVALDFGSSAGVGELCDLFLGLTYMLPTALLYKKYRSNKSIIFGLIIGVILSTIMAIATNVLFIIPLYATVLGGWDNLTALLVGFFPSITKANFYSFYIPFAVIPFNLLRGAVCGVMTYFLYRGLWSFDKTLFR